MTRAAAAVYLLVKSAVVISLGREVLHVDPPSPPVASRDPWDPIRGGLRHRARTGGAAEAVLLGSMYREMHFRPLWVTPEALTDDGRRLVLLLSSASREGLVAAEHRLLEIEHLIQQAFPPGGGSSPGWIADLEWALSRTALSYTSELTQRRAPSRPAEEWHPTQ